LLQASKPNCILHSYIANNSRHQHQQLNENAFGSQYEYAHGKPTTKLLML
jgi:hypothetical protein